MLSIIDKILSVQLCSILLGGLLISKEDKFENAFLDLEKKVKNTYYIMACFDYYYLKKRVLFIIISQIRLDKIILLFQCNTQSDRKFRLLSWGKRAAIDSIGPPSFFAFSCVQCFCVSVIHRTLTGTTGSLMCVHSYACVYTWGWGTPTRSQHNILTYVVMTPACFVGLPLMVPRRGAGEFQSAISALSGISGLSV